MLDLEMVKRERLQLILWTEIERDSLLLESRHPEATNFRQASVEVADLEIHVQILGFDCAKGEEISDKPFQALFIRLHVGEDLALLSREFTGFSITEKFDVAVHDR